MTTQTFSVVGMTCDHCVAAVTQEVSRVPGVRDVAIELVPGAVSTVTLTSDLPVSEDDVRAAVDEAGYDLAG
jgi:copper chaperone